MKEESIFLDVVGDSPVMRILQFLIEGRHFDYTFSDLARASGVSWATLYVVFPKLLKYGLVRQVRQVGRAKLYKINQDNQIAKYFIKLYDFITELNLKKLEKPLAA